jgi:hypothetical protein
MAIYALPANTEPHVEQAYTRGAGRRMLKLNNILLFILLKAYQAFNVRIKN